MHISIGDNKTMSITLFKNALNAKEISKIKKAKKEKKILEKAAAEAIEKQ